MNLVDYLPDFYRGDAHMVAIQQAIAPQIVSAWAAHADLMAQMAVNTATWGLIYWEQALGIEPDLSKALTFRRARVNAKRRGMGATTVAVVQSVAEGYTTMDVAVEEYPAAYRIEIHFMGVLGAPANLGDLQEALYEILPAHLACDYVFRYQVGTLFQRPGFFIHVGDELTILMDGR